MAEPLPVHYQRVYYCFIGTALTAGCDIAISNFILPPITPDLAAHMPEGLGCSVSAVGSGEEAVAYYVRTHPLDLLLFYMKISSTG